MYPYFARKVEQSWPFQWDRLYLYRQKSPYLPHISTVCMIQNAPKKKQSKSTDSNKKFTQFCDQLNYCGIIGNFMLRNRIYITIHTVMYGCHNMLNLLPPLSPWTKWPPFHRRYIGINFWNEKFCILIKILLKFVPKGPIDINPTLV